MISNCGSLFFFSLNHMQYFFFCRQGANENPFQEVEEPKNQSVVFVGVDNSVVGLIYFEDQIREDAGFVVESLSRLGINTYMLSGDKRSTAEYVASVIGIPKERVRNTQLSFLTTFHD